MSDSSSSVAGRPETLQLDLRRTGLLPPLPAALLAGLDGDLLEPLRFLLPGEGPATPAPAVDRRRIGEALAESNRAYGHPGAAERARRFADPATRVVVTGQQPGLLGGPLYGLIKAIAAVRWAERLSEAGEPAVAVFWMATEDHDWAEVAQASFLLPDGLRTFDLGPDPAPLLPVGMRTFGAALAPLLDALRAQVHEPDAAQALERMADWYRPEARFGEAFARLLVGLLGERSPLVIDAMLPAIKLAERPWLARLVRERQAVESALQTGDARIAERGFPLQVGPQPGAAPLFLLQGGARRRIVWQGADRFALRGAEGSFAVGALLQAIAENPAVVSPGVLARPAVQDAVLGTSLFVVGPGELSYLPQAAAVHRVLGVAGPAVALRPQALILQPALRRLLDGFGDSAADVLAPGDGGERLTALRGGESFVPAQRARLLSIADELRAPALALDPNLERPWQKTREQIERALEAFGGKVDASLARRETTLAGRIERLREAALPGGRPQERVLAVADLVLRYGWQLPARLLDALTLGPALHVVSALGGRTGDD